MNNWKFGAFFAGDNKSISGDLFVGTYRFILNLHMNLVYTSTAFFVSNNCRILVHLCVYISKCDLYIRT